MAIVRGWSAYRRKGLLSLKEQGKDAGGAKELQPLVRTSRAGYLSRLWFRCDAEHTDWDSKGGAVIRDKNYVDIGRAWIFKLFSR